MITKPDSPGHADQPGAVGANVSDAMLATRMANGDELAFAELVGRHVGALCAIARRMLGDDAEAEDVAQEAMLKLWRTGSTLTLGADGVRPWLRRVVSNMCIDRIRTGRRTLVTDQPPETPLPARQVEALEANELAQRVDQALQTLPDRQRQALTLFHFEGMSQLEVGAEMGISDEAVESLLARARRSLRTALATDWRELISCDDGV